MPDADDEDDAPAPPLKHSSGGSSANVPKTPVSLLQELYVRKGITPKYDLVQIEGQVHEPTFKYRVTVADLVATGCGQSKKKAKHSAAKTMIEKLKHLSISPAGMEGASPAVAKVAADVPSLEAVDMLSPYDDGIAGNPVGELQELCMNRRMQPPMYTVHQEKGAPHERYFVMVCSVGVHLKEIGTGKSKKLAKRQAAHQMLTSLKGTAADNEDAAFRLVDDDELAQGIVTAAAKGSGCEGAAGGGATSGPVNPFSRLNKFHRNLKLSVGVHLKGLHDDDVFDANFASRPQEALLDVGEEQAFIATFVDVEERSRDDKAHCFVQLSTTPVAVCFGVGDTADLAQVDAAHNALHYLRLMTKP